MLNVVALLISVLLVVFIIWMPLTTLLLARILRRVSRKEPVKQVVPVEQADSNPTGTSNPELKLPMDMDILTNELWEILHREGVYITQWEHLIMMYGKHGFQKYDCQDGRTLVWYGNKQPAMVRAGIDADRKERKQQKKDQRPERVTA